MARILVIVLLCSCSQQLTVQDYEKKFAKKKLHSQKNQKKAVNIVISSYFIGYLLGTHLFN